MTTAARFAARVEAELRDGGDPVRGAGARRYLKIDLECLGCGAAAIRSAVDGALREEPGLDHRRLVAFVRALWARPVWDVRAAAMVLLERRADLLAPGDLALLERLIRDSGTWALVDGLAVHAVWPLVARHPELEATLDRWVRDEDFWVRRSALLAHLLPLRRGGGDFERFARRADALLDESLEKRSLLIHTKGGPHAGIYFRIFYGRSGHERTGIGRRRRSGYPESRPHDVAEGRLRCPRGGKRRESGRGHQCG